MTTQSSPNAESRFRFTFLMRHTPVRILRYLRKHFKTLILAWSGGTDSTLLLLIAREYNIPIDEIVFVNTKLEYRSTLEYVKEVSKRLGLKTITQTTTLSASQLAAMIVEDYDKMSACSHYEKSKYRCCYWAKEKPMTTWLKTTGYDQEGTCILRGIRGVDSSSRMMICLQMIESGGFYYYDYKSTEHCKVAHPIQFMPDQLKEDWLSSATDQYRIPKPEKSGCTICPIFFKFADAEERKSPRWKLAERFFSKRSKTVLDRFFRNELSSRKQGDKGEASGYSEQGELLPKSPATLRDPPLLPGHDPQLPSAQSHSENPPPRASCTVTSVTSVTSAESEDAASSLIHSCGTAIIQPPEGTEDDIVTQICPGCHQKVQLRKAFPSGWRFLKNRGKNQSA